ncbi:MAG: hypothetical protein KAH48_00270, partial [Chlorobi bacterium]|nr:hypothetical protein [Chlorobiota bacterium]
GWKMPNSAINIGYKAEIAPKGYKSKRCLSISASPENKIKVVKNNQVYSRKLNGGISFSMPLTLYMDSVRTLPYPSGCAELQNVKPKDFVMSGSDRSSRLAIVSIVWNLFKHFGLNDNKAKVWDRALKYALQDAAICKNDDQFLEILELLTVEVNDGQSRAWASKDRVIFSYPFNWTYLNKKVYISKIAADFIEFAPGDQVLSINGQPTKAALKELSASVSAVRTATRYKATLEKIRLGNKGDEIELKIRTASGKTKKATVLRTFPPADLVTFMHDRFSEKAPGIFYANLTQMNDRGIKLIVKELVDAKGIIFDLRGSSRVSPEFLGLFADESLDGPEISIPIYTMPDHKLISYKTINKLISAKNPKLDIKVVFLADENTIGLAETVLATAKANGIGTIIGSTTAGTPSEVFGFTLPADFNISISAMNVLAPGGGKIYKTGVLPDIKVIPNLVSIQYIRDNVLEAAVKIIQKQTLNNINKQQ